MEGRNLLNDFEKVTETTAAHTTRGTPPSPSGVDIPSVTPAPAMVSSVDTPITMTPTQLQSLVGAMVQSVLAQLSVPPAQPQHRLAEHKEATADPPHDKREESLVEMRRTIRLGRAPAEDRPLSEQPREYNRVPREVDVDPRVATEEESAGQRITQPERNGRRRELTRSLVRREETEVSSHAVGTSTQEAGMQEQILELQRELKELKGEKIDRHRGARPRIGSQFAEAILNEDLPKNFKYVTMEYDGKTDPLEHLQRFETAALLHRYGEGVKCRVFVTTFTGAAQQWFHQLGEKSIGSFEDLSSLFLHQFVSAKKQRRTSLSLFNIKQGENETLRSFIKRFSSAALEVSSTSSEVKVNAFTNGLADGEFFSSLVKKTAATFEELLFRAEKYVNLEDSRRAKKTESGFAVKGTRKEVPSEDNRGRGLGQRSADGVGADRAEKAPGRPRNIQNTDVKI